MKAFGSVSLISTLLSIATALPLGDDNSTAQARGLEKRAFNEADFQGFNWDALHNGECNPEQQAIVRETVRKIAQEFVPFAMDNFDKHVVWDGAFHNFYMGRNQGSDYNRVLYQQIRYNLNRAWQYPQFGPPTNNAGTKPKSKLIKLRCNPVPDPSRRPCDNGAAGAYTLPGWFTTTGPEIVFCPKFWTNELPYLNDVTNNGLRGSKKIQQVPLIASTKEHVLLHEYFHVDEMGYWRPESPVKEHIGDRAYGVYDAAKLARVRAKDGLNVDTLFNADTYALYASAAWFQAKFGWRWNEKSFDYSWYGWHALNGYNPHDELKRSVNDTSETLELRG